MTVFLLILAGFAAWFVSTLAGGGAAVLLIPVVHFLVGVQAVAPVVTVSTALALPSRVYLFWNDINWRIVAWYLPAAMVGAFMGGYVFANAHIGWLQILIGLFLISTVFQYRFGERQKSFAMQLWMFAPVGLVVAFISGIIGGAGPLLNPFYLNYGTVKNEMVGTRSFNGFMVHTTKLLTYAGFGAMTGRYFFYGLVVGLAAWAATWLGKDLLERMKVRNFRRFVVIVMAIAGMVMIWERRDMWLPPW